MSGASCRHWLAAFLGRVKLVTNLHCAAVLAISAIAIGAATATATASPVGLASPTSVRSSSSQSEGNFDSSQDTVRFSRGLKRFAVRTLVKTASSAAPVTVSFETGEWRGWLRVTTADSPVVSRFIKQSHSARGPRSVTAVTGSAAVIRRALTRYQSTGEVSPQAIGGSSYTYDPATSGCREALMGEPDEPRFPSGWTANVAASGRLTQFRQQGLVERTSHRLRGVGNENGQWPCTHRLIDGTQGQGFKLTSALAYEHDYKIDQCGRRPYVEHTGEGADTNIPLAYLDTRASDTDCVVDFTVGTVAPFLMHKANTYTIDTWGDADGSVATALRSRARLASEVLDINGIGCSMNEYPRGVIQGEGNPWCVNVVPPFAPVKVINFIRLPDFVVKYDGTCYQWVKGSGYTWCGGGLGYGADPN